MTITLSFASWHLPLAITIMGFFATVFIAWRESKTCGDFGLPLFTMATACCAFASTITAWAVYLVLR